MKNIILIPAGDIGGAQTWVYNKDSKKNPKKHIILVLRDGTLVTNLLALGFNVEKTTYIKSFFVLLRLIYTERIRFIECHSTFMGILGRVTAYLTCTKCVYVSHGWGVQYTRGLKSLIGFCVELLLGQLGYTVLCVSVSDYTFAHRKLKINKKNLKIHRYRVDAYVSSLDSLKKIFVVMRDSKPKRYDLVFELAVAFPALQFICFGLPKTKQPPIHNVRAVGLSAEIPYEICDAVMLLSDSEGFPMVSLEAANHKKPLFMSDLPVYKEVVSAGVNVYAVDNHNAVQSFRTHLE